MKNLSVDLETYSSLDIGKSGVYRYVEAPDFEILLFGYSADGAPVRVIDLASGERLPDEIRSALQDETVTKWAFNASFERVCLSRYLGLPSGSYLAPAQWRCSMVWAAYLGLSLSLAGVGAVLRLDKQKLETGRDLIRYFTVPCAPTKTNGGRTRNLPSDVPDKWAMFKSYNLRDVETEMAIQEEELKPLVDAWRESNPHITQLWWDADEAVREAVSLKTSAETHGILFSYERGFLFITPLPSGRRLAYVKPRIGENQYGGESVTYEGIGSTKKWERLESYGPKFVENIVQAISRDILCYAMKTLRHCNIVAHVHDELIIEADPGTSLQAVCEQMGRTPPWAKGLMLRADGYETSFYKKD